MEKKKEKTLKGVINLFTLEIPDEKSRKEYDIKKI